MTQHDGAQLSIAVAKAQAAVREVVDFAAARKAASDDDVSREVYHAIERELAKMATDLEAGE